jgi:hypothetical protein
MVEEENILHWRLLSFRWTKDDTAGRDILRILRRVRSGAKCHRRRAKVARSAAVGGKLGGKLGPELGGKLSPQTRRLRPP